jgi:anti-sigma B factor antagonist
MGVPGFHVVVNDAPAGVAIVAVEGEFDMAALDDVTAAIRPHLDREVVVDLSRLSFMDSCGVQCLLRLQTEAARRGGRLRVGQVSHVVERLVQLLALDDVLRPAS